MGTSGMVIHEIWELLFLGTLQLLGWSLSGYTLEAALEAFGEL